MIKMVKMENILSDTCKSTCMYMFIYNNYEDNIQKMQKKKTIIIYNNYMKLRYVIYKFAIAIHSYTILMKQPK